jgi:hypothetical protein
MKKAFLLSAYLFANGLFVYKYGYRITPHGFGLIAAYGAFAAAVLLILVKMPDKFFSNRTLWILAALVCAGAAIALQLRSQTGLRVDRHEMVRLFWDNAFSGQNPYLPENPQSNVPGPFPFYFILALPFKGIGEMGYFSLSGVIVFMLLVRSAPADDRRKTAAMVLCAVSPAVWYEIVARSTVFLNAVLILAWMILAENTRGRASRITAFVWGFSLGCLLCTRSIAFFMLVPFLRRLRTLPAVAGFAREWISGTFLGFFLFLAPLLLFDSFRHGVNPFSIQASIMPAWLAAPVFIAFVAASFRTSSFENVLFLESVFLFLLLAVYILDKTVRFGWNAVVFRHHADISYLLFVLPAALYTGLLTGSLGARRDAGA